MCLNRFPAGADVKGLVDSLRARVQLGYATN